MFVSRRIFMNDVSLKILNSPCFVSAKETTLIGSISDVLIRAWIPLHCFEGVREWRWLCSVTFTDLS
jgi:hypothetical protein